MRIGVFGAFAVFVLLLAGTTFGQAMAQDSEEYEEGIEEPQDPSADEMEYPAEEADALAAEDDPGGAANEFEPAAEEQAPADENADFEEDMAAAEEVVEEDSSATPDTGAEANGAASGDFADAQGTDPEDDLAAPEFPPASGETPTPVAEPAPPTPTFEPRPVVLRPVEYSVETTPLGDIQRSPAARAVVERALPAITQYYDQVGTMTLAQIAPMSQGAIDDAKLREIQAEFDKLARATLR